MKSQIFSFLSVLGLLAMANPAPGQSSVRGPLPPEARAKPYLFQPFTPERWDASSFAPPKAFDWWREARFGMFIHFGVSSLRGVELGWGRGTHLPPDGGKGPIPDEVYDNLYKDFKIENFDAKEWVRIARDAGVKYVILITKHHDGFHMWDTAFSDYKITNAAFGRDYVKEVVDACHEAKMPIGFYFAQREWYHPQYNPTGKDPTRDHRKYIEYEFNAVRELLTKYGKIDVLWFDAAWWNGMFLEENWDSEKLYRMARELQPDILINNRASIPGDFDTPEQHLGSFQNNRPWESCITMLASNSWAYNPKSGPKPLKQLIQLIVGAATGDGNCLLNVGPRADGTIQPSETERLHEIGEWMRKYGQTIYGTRGGPYLNGAWGGSTHKGNKIWIHLLDGKGNVRLGPLPYRVKSAKALTGGEVAIQSTGEALILNVPTEFRDPMDTIIELTVDEEVPDTRVVGGNIANWDDQSKYGKVLNLLGGMNDSPAGEVPAWSQTDLGKSYKVNAVGIHGHKDESLKGLSLSISTDGKKWEKVWTAPDNSGSWIAEVSRIQAGAYVMGLPARYLRFESGVGKAGKIGIERLEVYGE